MYNDGVIPKEYAHTYAFILEKHLLVAKHFDLILLGMGGVWLYSIIIPGEAVLKETDKKVDACFLKSQDMHRITLTAPLLNDHNSKSPD